MAQLRRPRIGRPTSVAARGARSASRGQWRRSCSIANSAAAARRRRARPTPRRRRGCRAAPRRELIGRGPWSERRAVRAILGHGLVGVGRCEHARADRDRGPGRSAMVSRAVQTLMMHPRQRGQRREQPAPAEYALAVVGVQPHLFPVGRGQRAPLLPDPVGDRRAPDVMQQRGALQRDRVGPRNTEALGCTARERGDARGMAVVERRLQVDRVAEGAADRVQRRAGHLDHRIGLRLDGRPNRVCSRQLGENRLGSAAELLRDHGIERPARAAAGRPHRQRDAAEPIEERCLRGHLGDACRRGDLLPPQASRGALPVPGLEDLVEAALHPRPQSDATRGAGRHLAVRAAVALREPLRAHHGHAGGVQSRQRARAGRQAGQVGEQDVARVAEVRPHGRRLHRDVVPAQKGRCLVGVRRAADVLQQGGVVDIGCLGDGERPDEPRGDEACPCGLAGLETHPHVGDQRKPHQELGEPQTFRVGSRDHPDRMAIATVR
jgi:hypothetical protein